MGSVRLFESEEHGTQWPYTRAQKVYRTAIHTCTGDGAHTIHTQVHESRNRQQPYKRAPEKVHKATIHTCTGEGVYSNHTCVIRGKMHAVTVLHVHERRYTMQPYRRAREKVHTVATCTCYRKRCIKQPYTRALENVHT